MYVYSICFILYYAIVPSLTQLIILVSKVTLPVTRIATVLTFPTTLNAYTVKPLLADPP